MEPSDPYGGVGGGGGRGVERLNTYNKDLMGPWGALRGRGERGRAP